METLKVDKVLESLFAKIGKQQFEMDIMREQMTALENENKQLRTQLGGSGSNVGPSQEVKKEIK